MQQRFKGMCFFTDPGGTARCQSISVAPRQADQSHKGHLLVPSICPMKIGQAASRGCLPKLLQSKDVFRPPRDRTLGRLMHARELIAEVLRTNGLIPGG